MLVSEGAKTRLSGQSMQELLIKGVHDFLILDCFLRFFVSNLNFIVESMERHCIAYGVLCL